MKASQKIRKRKRRFSGTTYSHTKIKARNFLTNISYRRLNKNDDAIISFAVDCYSFIAQNLNPFTLKRKFSSVTDQHYVNMMWEKCMPKSFHKFIFLEENFMLLNQLEVTYQKANKIANEYILHEKKTIELHQYFKEFQLIFQYVYSLLFPKYVNLNQKYKVKNRSKFMFCYKEWVDSKKKSPPTAELGKQPENYKNRPESPVQEFGQKPIKENDEQKFVPSTPKPKKSKSTVVDALKAKN